MLTMKERMHPTSSSSAILRNSSVGNEWQKVEIEWYPSFLSEQASRQFSTVQVYAAPGYAKIDSHKQSLLLLAHTLAELVVFDNRSRPSLSSPSSTSS